MVKFEDVKLVKVQRQFDDIDEQALTFLAIFRDTNVPDEEVGAVIQRMGFWLNSGISKEDLQAYYDKLYPKEAKKVEDNVPVVGGLKLVPVDGVSTYGFRTGD